MKCNNCHGVLVRSTADAYIYCSVCGQIDTERVFEETSTLKGQTYDESSLSTDEKSMTTYIDAKNKDAYGKSINFKNKRSYDYLRIWQRKLYNNTFDERSLHTAEAQSERLVNALHLNLKIKYEMMRYFRVIKDKNLSKGKNIARNYVCYIIFNLFKAKYTSYIRRNNRVCTC